MGELRIVSFLIACMIAAVATGCTTTKYVGVKNSQDKPVEMAIKYNRFSKELVSVTLPGEQVGVSGPITIDKDHPIDGILIGFERDWVLFSGVGCQVCYYNYILRRWVWYPSTCRCP